MEQCWCSCTRRVVTVTVLHGSSEIQQVGEQKRQKEEKKNLNMLEFERGPAKRVPRRCEITFIEGRIDVRYFNVP